MRETRPSQSRQQRIASQKRSKRQKERKRNAALAEARTAVEQKKLEQELTAAELASRKVGREHHDEFIKFARETIDAAAQGRILNKDGAALIDLSPQRFGKHVEKARLNGYSVYNGNGHGRPAYITDADKENLAKNLIHKRSTRKCDEAEQKATLYTQLVDRSLKARGHTPLKAKAATVSRGFITKLEAEVGIGTLKAGRDNKQRQDGLIAPRNGISNFAAALSVCDAKYTDDKKDVHPRLRFNIDAMQTYSQNVSGDVVTICKKTKLFEDNPDLADALDEARTQPATMQGDILLNQL